MLIIMKCQNGRRVEGLMLAMDDNRLRVAVHRLNETLEFRQMDGIWVGEKGNAVEIESVVFPSNEPAVMTAGHALAC